MGNKKNCIFSIVDFITGITTHLMKKYYGLLRPMMVAMIPHECSPLLNIRCWRVPAGILTKMGRLEYGA